MAGALAGRQNPSSPESPEPATGAPQQEEACPNPAPFHEKSVLMELFVLNPGWIKVVLWGRVLTCVPTLLANATGRFPNSRVYFLGECFQVRLSFMNATREKPLPTESR